MPENPPPSAAQPSAMVASAHPQASQAGITILKAGGNAFDAAVATAAALNVVEPYMSGMTGMGFATIWVAAEQRVRVLDFVPPIPLSFPHTSFRSRAELQSGPAAVASPGNLAGWCTLRDTYGRLPLPQLLAPAIQLAEQGFRLNPFGVEEMTTYVPIHAAAPAYGPAFAATFPLGPATQGHEDLRRPDLATTLHQIAQHGPATLYTGDLGRRLTTTLQSLGGTLTMDDLAAVAPAWRDPISITYRGLQIHVPPPPCEGFQFLLTLRLLEGFDIAALGQNTAAQLDLVFRAIRLAAAARIANNLPNPQQLAELLSPATVETLRNRLREGDGLTGPTEQWTAEPPPGADPGHTTSFSTADSDGNLVCITQSLGSVFGSGVTVPGTGLCLNNFLYWADVQPGSPNRATPGLPLAMCMAPTISTRNNIPELALGTPGSYGILQTQAQAIVAHLDFALPIQAAIDAPRARLWDGRRIELENRIPPAVIAELRTRGHDAKPFPTPWTMRVGGMQAIHRTPQGHLQGAADPRRHGAVATL